MINIFSFLPDLGGAISYLINLFKILLSYLCILLCINCKDKCIDNDDEIDNDIKSPTPLLSDNVKKHPILDEYENKILNKIKENS